MKKVKKIAILIILAICILLLSENDAQAMTSQEAGKYIANYALNYRIKHGTETEYNNVDGEREYYRGLAYNGQKAPTGYYEMDCVGFVSLVVHNATGLDDPNVSSGQTGFVAPGAQGTENEYYPEYFDIVDLNSIEPGDILANTHHVMVYVGGGKIVHCDGNGATDDSYNGEGAISYESIEHYRDGNDYRHEGVLMAFRIREDIAENAKGNAGGDMHDIDSGGGIGAIIDKIIEWADELLGEDNDNFKPGKRLSEEDEKKLYYKGLAVKKGEKTEAIKDDNWSFFNVSSVVDWVVGFATMPIRGALTGYAQIVQLGASKYIAIASGETTQINTDIGLLDDLQNQMKNSLTLEKIVYNKVPLFDVNVFNTTTAGEKTIPSNSIMAVVRNLTAQWYYSLRLIAIIALLVILIYAGIKAAISTAASDKAQFKELLVNWLVAFTIVFFMQYFMIAVMQINETLVNIFAGIGKDLNLYESVRELTWSPKLSTGITATMLYIVLVYYLIRFIVIYLKRLFITILLIVIAPIVAAKFAFDKIRGGKDTSSLGKWVKEYVFSIVMQTTHALTYTIFVSSTVDLAKNGSHIIATVVIGWVFMYFMVRSEKIIRGLFKLVAGDSSTNVGDASEGGLSSDLKELFGITLLWDRTFKRVKDYVYRPAKSYVGNQMNDPKTLIGSVANSNIVQTAVKPVKWVANAPQNFYVWSQRQNLEELYGDLYNQYKEQGLSDSEIDKKLEEAIRQEYKMKRGVITAAIGTGLNVVSGIGKVTFGIPIFLVDSPVIGAGMMATGVKTLLTAAGRPIKGYKSPKNSGLLGTFKGTGAYQTMSDFANSRYIRYLVETMGTLTGSKYILRNIMNVYDQKIDVLQYYKPEELKLIYEARGAEYELLKELGLLKDKEFKGYGDNATAMELSLAQNFEKKLIGNIQESQKTVSKSKIKEQVEEYEQEVANFELSMNDLVEIAKKLQVEDPNHPSNNIIIREEIKDNMRSVIAAELAGSITKAQLSKSLLFDNDNLDVMVNKVQDIMEDLNEEDKRISEKDKNSKKQAAELSLYLLEKRKNDKKDKTNSFTLEELSGKVLSNETDKIKETTKETSEEGKKTEMLTMKDVLDKIKEGHTPEVDLSKLPETEQKEIRNVMQSAITDNMVDTAIEHMSIDEITSSMKKAIDMKGSIEKKPVSKRFSKVIEQAEKLRDINEKLAEMGGIDIGKDAKLIEREEKKLYEPGELIDLVRKGINSPKKDGK